MECDWTVNPIFADADIYSMKQKIGAEICKIIFESLKDRLF